ncbi:MULTISPECIES: hypothetical protein [unclassified Brevibacterium]|uniref:hypothetical protein n=1 Tax=unclassified Brevibacterium TaxID=2614124 RepID=UPI0010F7BE25|nr:MULTISPECIES: hypothetical protein [unclassified Brevibacterium]MCM1014216.1 hypothetical protein [Brevibacterium sp. XM4083]
MRTGIATPARRTTIRRRLRTVAAIAAVAAVGAVVTGCEDNSPVAAPTSTLPAAGPSAGESTPAVPEYTTDLDLTDDEKKAVDGALVAFEGFWTSVNEAYAGDFGAAEDFSKYARGEALESIEGDIDVIEDGSYVFQGNIVPTKVNVASYSPPGDTTSPESVSVQFCFDLTEWSLAPKDQSTTPKSDDATMEHVITREDGAWKVSSQSLKERRC